MNLPLSNQNGTTQVLVLTVAHVAIGSCFKMLAKHEILLLCLMLVSVEPRSHFQRCRYDTDMCIFNVLTLLTGKLPSQHTVYLVSDFNENPDKVDL